MDPDLEKLAAAYGVATTYEDWRQRPVAVAEKTVRQVLTGLGADLVDLPAALQDAEDRPWRRLVAPTSVVIGGRDGAVDVHTAVGGEPVGTIRLESGGTVELGAAGPATAQRIVDGSRRFRCPLAVPPDLPLGYHELHVRSGTEQTTAVLAVVPLRAPMPAGLGRAWGWMVQLYAARSADSWGLGDYADLAELARWSGQDHGAGLLLVNPLHAFAPGGPVENSPYYPASRRFSSPLYLRPEQLGEYAAAPAEVRAQVDALAGHFSPSGDAATRIDRDATWAAKRQALELLFGYEVPRPDAEQSQGLSDFATWCALAEEHGPDWHEWPRRLHDPRTTAVAEERERLAERVALYTWLQRCCDEQLAAAQHAADRAGMSVGVVHDLAVGVDPGGADAWALQSDLARGFTVGAPPDSFNQQGQDWRLPPWRPDRLPLTGYAPLRDMVAAVLRKGGGLRVDHVLGLFRLWWVPDGAPASEGTYVRYDSDAMLGILALEADRAQALVVGEDLGTVPPEVRVTLAERGILGSSVLWFETDEDDPDAAPHVRAPLPPARWRELTMASVTTHDLPTAAGWLRGEQVRIRAELGLLAHSAADELLQVERERAALLELARTEGLLGDPSEADEETTVLALHLLLARSPSRVVLAALGDGVGDVRQPNLPGTRDEYPNWRLPLADGTGRPIAIEELEANPRAHRLATELSRNLRHADHTA